ncbi:MAG: hypothetical protein NC453_20505 [Muribaculum sp.]|nr:hypothetical protein [Muribaculum sp.]
MELTDKEKQQSLEYLQGLATEFIGDKNKIAKAIAVYLRNQIEDFHVKYLSDEQMRELNPLIRNAVFSFLMDYGSEYSIISSLENEEQCSEYIETLTNPFLKQALTNNCVHKFNKLISDSIGLPLMDLANGALMLAGYNMFYVPSYWEDCEYIKVK